MKQLRTLFFPEALAVLTESEDRQVRLVDFLDRRILHADGVLGRELLESVDSGEPSPLLASLGKIGSPIERIRKAAWIPLTAAAALRLQGWDTLFVELTLECTERCLHCYASAGPERTERLARETCFEVLEDSAALGFERVQFTGGDPLLCPFLDELLEAAARLGFETCEVFTNGLLLDEARLDELAGRGTSFAFSLYSASSEVHDRVTGIEGSHRRTCDAIAHASARGLEVRVAVVALEADGAGVEQTVALARSLGAGLVRATGSHAVGRGGFLEAKVPPGDASEDPAGFEAAACGREGTHLGVLCVAGDGAVYPCVFNRMDRLGRVPERRLREIVAAPELPSAPAEPEAFLAEVRRRLQCVSCQCTAWALRQT